MTRVCFVNGGILTITASKENDIEKLPGVPAVSLLQDLIENKVLI